MKPSTELFELIKSLTKSEKRFFKLTSSLQSGEKNYLKIFDAIDKQKDYDEETIKKQFGRQTFIKHFPSEKNHLYKLILKSLRAYHSDNSISSVLKQEIKNIEILYKKALFRECNKFLIRAKKVAIQHEKFYYWFELISWEKQLLEEAYEAGEFGQDLDALIKEEQEVIEKLRNLAEYHVLYSRVNYVFRSGGYARNDEQQKIVDEISQNYLIKGKNTALSTRAATICYYIKGLCASTQRNYDESFRHFLRVKQILDNNSLIRKDLAKRYVRTLSNLLYCYIDSHAFAKSFELIEKMRDLNKQKGFNTIDVQVKVFTSSYIAELMIYDKMGDYDKGVAILDDIIYGIEEFGDKINKEQEIVFYYNLAYTYFGAGTYNRALFWINKVMNDNEQHLRQDIYSFSRLFNLVIHFELGNYDLLEYIIKSTLRYLNKRQKSYAVESILLKHLKKLSRLSSDPEELKAQFIKLKGELNEAFEDKSENVVLEYFDFSAWVDAHIEGVPFAEVKKRGELAKAK
jgi:tetratricopeptide (TPR) repeat protein